MSSTYEPIATTTVSTSINSITFSSISSAYTDLVLVCQNGVTSGTANLSLRVGNGSADTGSNYSMTYLFGTGSSAGSDRNSSQTTFLVTYYGGQDATLNANQIIQFNNYSNTTTNKTILARSNRASSGVDAAVGLWRSTVAINTINCYTSNGTNWATGSTFTLYGIKSA